MANDDFFIINLYTYKYIKYQKSLKMPSSEKVSSDSKVSLPAWNENLFSNIED